MEDPRYFGSIGPVISEEILFENVDDADDAEAEDGPLSSL